MPEQSGTILNQYPAFAGKRSGRYPIVDKNLMAHRHGADTDFIPFTLFLQQMYLSVKKLFLLLRQSALLLVYGAFFLVQFFCITGSDNTTIPVATASHYKDPAKEKILTAKNDHSKKTKIRLNKRFQPSISDGILNMGEEAAIKYISCSNLSKTIDYLLISFILAASLRGPPVLG